MIKTNGKAKKKILFLNVIRFFLNNCICFAYRKMYALY